VDKIKDDFPILDLDEKYLENLERIYPDTDNKISDLVFTLKKYILVEKGKNPIMESISEKVEKIVKQRQEKLKTAEEIYQDLRQFVLELIQSKQRRIQLNLNELEYNCLLILEDRLGKSDQLVDDVKALFKEINPLMFKGWSLKKSITKDIGQIVRKKLRKYKFKQEELNEIYDKIMEILKKFD
ncbi:MAG: hypothetical protein ACTSPW_18345, partial [Promethearchaeota archaeon]